MSQGKDILFGFFNNSRVVGEEIRIVEEERHHRLLGNQISRILRMELAIN